MKEIFKKYQDQISILFLTIVLFILTFPKISPDIDTGLDPSYKYAFNYFFANNIQIGKDILFTYGPLGFLKSPLPVSSNLGIGIIAISLIRIAFIFVILYLGQLINKKRWLLNFLIVFILSHFLGFDYLIYGILASLLLIYRIKERFEVLVLASLITVFSLLIKVNVGLISSLIFGSFLLHEIIFRKKYKLVIFISATTVILFILSWLSFYSNLHGIVDYFHGWIVLSVGNSEALSITVENSWMILFLFLAIFILIPVLYRTKEIHFLYWIFALGFIATFKYAFARQENYHIKTFLDLTVLFVFLIIYITKDIKPLLIGLGFIMIMLFYRNMGISERYNVDDRIPFIGVNNFNETVLNFKSYKEKYKGISHNNLKEKVLDANIRERIGSNTVDCYPWDLTYIAANDLNYKPRPVIQAGAYDSWLDTKNSEFMASEEAAQFIIWEVDKNLGETKSIDNRYLLNDDPGLIKEIFNNYRVVKKTEKLKLLKRLEEPRFSEPQILKQEDFKWNEWIEVPSAENGFLRAKADFSKSFSGKLKSLFFRDNKFFIEYKLTSGEIIQHRFCLETALQGLWINPYITEISNNLNGDNIDQIRFISESPDNVNEEFTIQWEYTKTPSESYKDYETVILHESLNDFETQYSNWYTDTNRHSIINPYKGSKCFSFDSTVIYGSTFSIYYKDLPGSDDKYCSISAFANTPEKSNALIVFSVERDNKQIKWISGEFDKYITEMDKWQTVRLENIDLTALLPDDKIKIYVWNRDKKVFNLDDFKILFYSFK